MPCFLKELCYFFHHHHLALPWLRRALGLFSSPCARETSERAEQIGRPWLQLHSQCRIAQGDTVLPGAAGAGSSLSNKSQGKRQQPRCVFIRSDHNCISTGFWQCEASPMKNVQLSQEFAEIELSGGTDTLFLLNLWSRISTVKKTILCRNSQRDIVCIELMQWSERNGLPQTFKTEISAFGVRS